MNAVLCASFIRSDLWLCVFGVTMDGVTDIDRLAPGVRWTFRCTEWMEHLNFFVHHRLSPIYMAVALF